MDWIKRLGYFYNIARGSESISNQMSHLIVGVLSGLPTFAVSLRVSIAFYLGALLELPTGVLADVLGHRRTLIYGYAISAFASLCLFFSCHYSRTPASLPILVASSVLSAVGVGLVSGCLQAFIQDYIDQQVTKSGETGQQAEETRAKALARSQAYGNFFSAFVPTLVLAGVLANYYLTRRSEWALLVPVIVYGALATLFCVVRIGDEKHAPGKSFAAHCVEYGRQLALFRTGFRQQSRAGQFRLGLLCLRMVLSILTVIHVHTYLMVSQLRQIDLQHGSLKAIIMGFMVLAAFDLAHYPKGLIAPIVSKRLSANHLPYFSLIAQCVLGLLALFCFHLGYTVGAVIGFALLFNATFSPGHTTLQSKLLNEVPEHLRASVFSVVQVVVLVAYGSYSALLAATGVGVDRPDQIFVQLLSLTGLGIVLAVVFDCIAVSPLASVFIDDAQA
ncbi:MFS family permease [Paraburkholderia sp. GAS199]|uniref:MFS transporter n=1 Tax=Paraburkholderia sp. GAS199 TaxID=3035126 RepID=UPI003D1D0558